MRSLYALLLWALLATTSDAQILVPETVKPGEAIVAGCECIVPDGARVTFEWVTGEGVQRRDAPAPNEIHLWAVAGTHAIEVKVDMVKYMTITNFKPGENWPDDRTDYTLEEIEVIVDFSSTTYEGSFTVEGEDPDPGPGPGPGPDPNPDIPEDRFDNIGRDVDKWAREMSLGNAFEVGKVYKEAGDRLLGNATPILPTIDAGNAFVVEGIADIDGLDRSAWTPWASRVNERWQSGVIENRTDAGEFFLAVAAGLGVSE